MNVTARIMGDPAPDYWQRRANPGPPAHLKKVDAIGREARPPRNKISNTHTTRVTHNCEKYAEQINSIKDRLGALGITYRQLRKELAVSGVEIGESQMKLIMTGRYEPRHPRAIAEILAVLDRAEGRAA